MNLQYITDEKGETTGVFIPIHEWNSLKSKYQDIDNFNIPEWHKQVVNERLEDYKKNPGNAKDFNIIISEIENDI